ncbi:hypothetical protein KOY49_03660 [Candidatus Minimicrobia vallesae]|uniref:Uncharacterized protein n=1 Tax=Candidatus Minimicrobia vallesae TaxID=2841264 RepID=A0A8F1SA59_9BACT|nr:hypothetical protein [Candidatus Minimicrobia vallesae]QWQ31253.1 hypothetical protein KOY49_03660 [Candidatus Minimicrobia vallesae]
MTRSLTDRHVSENSHSYYMFSEEEVNKAFAALSSEIDFAKFFKDQAIKTLKNIDTSTASHQKSTMKNTSLLKALPKKRLTMHLRQ